MPAPTPRQSPLSRRELNKQATREGIFAAAMELFSTKGFEAATIEEIAQASGVSKGTVFNYFENKEAIVGYVAVRQLTWIVDHSDDLLAGLETVRARYERIFGTLVDRLVAEAESLRVALGLTLQRIGKPLEPQPAEVAFMHLLVKIASEGLATGELRRDLPPLQVPMLVLAMYAGSLTVAGQQVEARMLSRKVTHDIGLLFEGIAGR